MHSHSFIKATSTFKWLAPILLVTLFPHPSRFAWSFNFSVGPAGQCDPLNITWSGGTAPFSLVIAPLFEQFYNISIPSSSFNGATNTGSFSTQLPLSAGQKFVLTLSDATGFGTGGVSSLLVTGSSTSGSQCTTTSPHPPFTFSFLSPLQQCNNFVIGGYDGSIQPNTIRALIPLGQVISLTTDPTATSFSWLANVAAGTSMVFIMTDSTGQAGGASDLETVSNSNDASCLNANSPHSTASSTFTLATSSPTSSSSPTQTGSSDSKSGGVSTGVIAGIAAGVAIAILVALITAIICIRRRNREQRSAVYENDSQVVQAYQVPYSNNPTQSESIVRVSRQRGPQSVDLMSAPPASSIYGSNASSVGVAPSSQSRLLSPGNEYPPQSYHNAPHEYTTYDQHSQASRSSHYQSRFDGASSSSYSPQPTVGPQVPLLQPSLSPSPSPSPVANAPPMKSTHSQPSRPRFILHTDAEDPVEPAEDEVIELPPQYSERRAESAREVLPAPTGKS